MMKKLAIVFVLVLVVVLLGCQKPSEWVYPHEQIETPAEEMPEEPTEEAEVITPKADFCTHNENCTGGELCIERECQLLADFYETDDSCEKCNFKDIEILTSDGESYTLARGQGSYTAAGALDWTIVSGPDYCQGEEIIVPINILKRNYGEVFSDDVIMLKVGETSEVIKHPFIKRIAFTLKVVSVDEVCS